MSRHRIWIALVLGIAGYALYAYLFPRYSTSAQWRVQAGEEESIARARAVAKQHGVDVDTWRGEAGVRIYRPLNEASIHVGFINPRDSKELVGVRFAANGTPTGIVVQRERRSGDDVTVAAARPIADRAFQSFVPNPSSYKRVAEEDLGSAGVRFRWERVNPDPKTNTIDRARAIVSGNLVRDLRYGTEILVDKSRPLRPYDIASDLAVIFGSLFGLVLFIVAAGRGQVPQRFTITLCTIVWALLLVDMVSDLEPRLASLFSGGNASSRWTLILGAAVVAIPAALAIVSGYPSLRKRFPEQLLPFEEVLQRGRFTTRRAGLALLTGIAAGGWIALAPYLVRATGLFGNYAIDDAPVDPLFRSGFVPVSIFGSVVSAMIAFALLGAFVQNHLRGRAGTALAFALAALIFFEEDAPLLAPALASAVLVALLFDQLFRRTDLLTLFFAAVSAAWTTSAAARFMQPEETIRADGWHAVILGAIATVVAIAIALRGSTKPYLAWEPRPARAERERMQAEFDVARIAQERMLPSTAPVLPGTSIASFCRPAKQVGGDLFDFVQMSDGTTGITVADVSGKGVSAALVMTITKGLLLAASDGRSDPLQTLADVNAGIHSLGHRSVFVTMLFGVFDPIARTFQFVRAGHTPLLWRKASGEVEALSPRGIGVGMTSARMFPNLCERKTITTAPGDFLFLFSDGVNEAMNERSEEFGEDRLIATLRDSINSAMTAEEARVVLVDAVDQFRGNAAAHDDMTVVVVKT